MSPVLGFFLNFRSGVPRHHSILWAFNGSSIYRNLCNYLRFLIDHSVALEVPLRMFSAICLVTSSLSLAILFRTSLKSVLSDESPGSIIMLMIDGLSTIFFYTSVNRYFWIKSCSPTMITRSFRRLPKFGLSKRDPYIYDDDPIFGLAFASLYSGLSSCRTKSPRIVKKPSLKKYSIPILYASLSLSHFWALSSLTSCSIYSGPRVAKLKITSRYASNLLQARGALSLVDSRGNWRI